MGSPPTTPPRVMRGADGSAAGASGYAPTPAAGQQAFMLLGDGTWGAQPIAGLPSQTSNSGKLLTTDGTNAAWTTAGVLTSLTAATDLTLAGGSTSGKILFNSPSATERGRFTDTGNLLIGTTTDIAGSGGLHVAGTGTASTTTSGAFRVGTNVGLSGNAGGASYFGGQVSSAGGGTTATLPFTSANATLGGFEVYSGSATANQRIWQWQAGTAIGDGTIRLRAINDALSNGSNAISITRTGDAVGTITLGTAAAIVNLPGTTEATTTAGVGALTTAGGIHAAKRIVSDSTEASVGSTTGSGIFAGGIYAGAASYFAGAVTIGNTVNAVSPTSPDRTITMVVGGVTLYIAAKTTNN